jgi:thiamine pyrophosphate-dependent acetolactate synthase large subunit-like protein
VRVDRPGEIAPALERALGSGRPVVLDIAIDPEELGAHRPKTVSRTAPR